MTMTVLPSHFYHTRWFPTRGQAKKLFNKVIVRHPVEPAPAPLRAILPPRSTRSQLSSNTDPPPIARSTLTLISIVLPWDLHLLPVHHLGTYSHYYCSRLSRALVHTDWTDEHVQFPTTPSFKHSHPLPFRKFEASTTTISILVLFTFRKHANLARNTNASTTNSRSISGGAW